MDLTCCDTSTPQCIQITLGPQRNHCGNVFNLTYKYWIQTALSHENVSKESVGTKTQQKLETSESSLPETQL